MIYIKLDDGMCLTITVNEPIYRGDNLNQKITYLIPLQVEDIDMAVAAAYLCYVRADGAADVVRLDRMEDKYKEAYYQYAVPVTCKLSKYPGEICTWLQIYSGTPSNPTISKSSECMLYVEESKNMDDYFCDHQMRALYQMQKQLDDSLSAINETVNTAISGKADNIIFNSEDSTIQLSANGEPIGDKVYVCTSTGLGITDVEVTDGGELLVSFDDGSSRNLGVVVGKDGGVYVPHVDEHKVLTFTVEPRPTAVPNPVDLNPKDEWIEMADGNGISTDYIWETI